MRSGSISGSSDHERSKTKRAGRPEQPAPTAYAEQASSGRLLGWPETTFGGLTELSLVAGTSDAAS